jgi:hypothetical protein
LNLKDPNNGGTRILEAAFDAAGVPALGGIPAEFSTGRSRYDGLNVSSLLSKIGQTCGGPRGVARWRGMR